MRTAKGLRVHVILEKHEFIEKHILEADDSRAADLQTSLDSDIEMKENTKLINSAFDGKDYEASRRRVFPSPHEDFDSGVVLNLHSAFIQGDILKQTDSSHSQCLTLIDSKEADSRALLDFLDEMSTFEPEYLTDVTFVVDNEDRKRELERQCGEIFSISRNKDDKVIVNDNVTSSVEGLSHISTDSNGNSSVSSSNSKDNIERLTSVDGFRSMTSINLTCEGKIISSNLGGYINDNDNVTSMPTSTIRGINNSNNVHVETIDVISSETLRDKSEARVNVTDRCDVMIPKNKSDVMVTLKNKHDVMVTLKDKNDVMLTTLNGEFEPLLTQGGTHEDTLDVKLSVTDQIFSGFRKVAQLVMDSMVSVKTEDEDDQPYGEPS